MNEEIAKRFLQSAEILRLCAEQLADKIEQASRLIVDSYRHGGGVIAFGNGGSAADAEHIACELVGRFLRERKALRAQALTCNGAVISSVANDYDFAAIFARQIEAAGRPGDVAIGLSTSGNSANVVRGLQAAKAIGMKTIAMTGSSGGACQQYADVLLNVPASLTPRIQEAHAVTYHTLCELVEQAMAENHA